MSSSTCFVPKAVEAKHLEEDTTIIGGPLEVVGLGKISGDAERIFKEFPVMPTRDKSFDSARSSSIPLSCSRSAKNGTDLSKKSKNQSLSQGEILGDHHADGKDSMRSLNSLPRNGGILLSGLSGAPHGRSHGPAITDHTARTDRRDSYVQSSLKDSSQALPSSTSLDPRSPDNPPHCQESGVKHWNIEAWREYVSASLDNTASESPDAEEQRGIRTPRAATSPEISSSRSTEVTPQIDEKAESRKTLQRYLHFIPWILAWVIVLILCCAVIGHNHKHKQSPSRTVTNVQINDLEQNRRVYSFEEKTFVYSKVVERSIRYRDLGQHNASITNATGSAAKMTSPVVSKKVATTNSTIWKSPLPLRELNLVPSPLNITLLDEENWKLQLERFQIRDANNSYLSMRTTVHVQHTVNMTAVCPPVKICSTVNNTKPDKPNILEEPSQPQLPAEPLLSPQDRQYREPPFVTYVRNILACLWLLPLWLLARVILKRSHLSWLTPSEGEGRMRIVAVALSFSVAAALALATEEMVKAAVNSTKRT